MWFTTDSLADSAHVVPENSLNISIRSNLHFLPAPQTPNIRFAQRNASGRCTWSWSSCVFLCSSWACFCVFLAFLLGSNGVEVLELELSLELSLELLLELEAGSTATECPTKWSDSTSSIPCECELRSCWPKARYLRWTYTLDNKRVTHTYTHVSCILKLMTNTKDTLKRLQRRDIHKIHFSGSYDLWCSETMNSMIVAVV